MSSRGCEEETGDGHIHVLGMHYCLKGLGEVGGLMGRYLGWDRFLRKTGVGKMVIDGTYVWWNKD